MYVIMYVKQSNHTNMQNWQAKQRTTEDSDHDPNGIAFAPLDITATLKNCRPNTGMRSLQCEAVIAGELGSVWCRSRRGVCPGVSAAEQLVF